MFGIIKTVYPIILNQAKDESSKSVLENEVMTVKIYIFFITNLNLFNSHVWYFKIIGNYGLNCAVKHYLWQYVIFMNLDCVSNNIASKESEKLYNFILMQLLQTYYTFLYNLLNNYMITFIHQIPVSSLKIILFCTMSHKSISFFPHICYFKGNRDCYVPIYLMLWHSTFIMYPFQSFPFFSSLTCCVILLKSLQSHLRQWLVAQLSSEADLLAEIFRCFPQL